MPGREVPSKRVSFNCSDCDEPTTGVVGTKRVGATQCTACFGKGVDRRPKTLNDLTGKGWAQKSKSVSEYLDTRSDKQRFHGASFPRSLAKEQIEIFTQAGQLVVDPFAGVGTTLDACHELGRKGIGVDVNQEFLRLARHDLLVAGATEDDQRLIKGDARQLSTLVAPESVDLLLTSPPYGSLLRNVKGAFAYKWQEHSQVRSVSNARPYSELDGDIGNLEYSEFLVAIQACLEQTYKVLKPDAYTVWVVKDFRAVKEDVPFVNYHGHLIERAEAAGLTLWDIRIWDQTRHRPLVCLGYPSRNYYLNIGHSYIVVLRKR